jgi:hypothetical protein
LRIRQSSHAACTAVARQRLANAKQARISNASVHGETEGPRQALDASLTGGAGGLRSSIRVETVRKQRLGDRRWDLVRRAVNLGNVVQARGGGRRVEDDVAARKQGGGRVAAREAIGLIVNTE